MQQLERAVLTGDVKELEEAIAVGTSALRHTSLYLPTTTTKSSSSSSAAAGVNGNETRSSRRELEQKVAMAKRLFVVHLEKCKTYVKALRKAARLRNYKMIKEALQSAQSAPTNIQQYMQHDMKDATLLLSRLADIRAQTRQVFGSRNWQQIDRFMNEHAHLLDDRTILALVQAREDLIRLERQNNERVIIHEQQDISPIIKKSISTGENAQKVIQHNSRTPHLRSVHATNSTHQGETARHERNSHNYRIKNDSIANNVNITHKTIPTERQSEMLVKTYTLPFTEPHSELFAPANATSVHSCEPQHANHSNKTTREHYWNKLENRPSEGLFSERENEHYTHNTQNKNMYSNHNEDMEVLQNSNEREEKWRHRNTTSPQRIHLEFDGLCDWTESSLRSEEESKREKLIEHEMNKRSTIYLNEMLECAPSCLGRDFVLSCTEIVTNNKNKVTNFANATSPVEINLEVSNRTAWRTLPVIRYSDSFENSPTSKCT